MKVFLKVCLYLFFAALGIGMALGIFGLFIWAVGGEMAITIVYGFVIVLVAIGIFAMGKSMGKEAGYQRRYKEEVSER